MSIRDYNQKYILINGTTNEKIPIPKIDNDNIIKVDMSLNGYILYQIITEELYDCDSITIFKSYMKD